KPLRIAITAAKPAAWYFIVLLPVDDLAARSAWRQALGHYSAGDRSRHPPPPAGDRHAPPGYGLLNFFCTRSSKRATLTTTRWCEPPPIGSLSSLASTRNKSVRPSTAVNSAVAR